MIAIDLPWPPSINHYYGRRPGGGVYIKAAGNSFRSDVVTLCRLHKAKMQTGRLAMFIRAYPPDKRKRDLDNIVKAVQDALQVAGCYENDCQIDALNVQRCESRRGGKVNVVICQHRTASQL